MKPKDLSNLRDLNTNELRQRLQDGKQELFNLRFQLATRSLTNYSRMTVVRRQIAVINTLLKERELGIR